MCSCPSRTDEPYKGEGYNQSPDALSADLTTNQDLNGIANTRENLGARAITSASQDLADSGGPNMNNAPDTYKEGGGGSTTNGGLPAIGRPGEEGSGGDGSKNPGDAVKSPATTPFTEERNAATPSPTRIERLKRTLLTFAQFVGPGFMIAVAYIDPGNYATDIAAGASYRFQLLFIVLLSNLFAILLQSLAIKLGTVTGLDLASACRAFLPRWLNYFLYALAEIAIIATDIAEVRISPMAA